MRACSESEFEPGSGQLDLSVSSATSWALTKILEWSPYTNTRSNPTLRCSSPMRRCLIGLGP